MTRIAGASVLFATLIVTTACGVGGDDGMTPPGGGSDDREDKLGIVCEASLQMTGTFTAGTPGRPLDPETNLPLTGCWPVGTWTFTASVASNACPTAPSLLPSYSFRVDKTPVGDGGDDTIESYANLTSAGDLQWHLKVSSNGQGCQGSFELGSADGRQYWNLQPLLSNTSTTQLAGQGDYVLYDTDSWPWGM